MKTMPSAFLVCCCGIAGISGRWSTVSVGAETEEVAASRADAGSQGPEYGLIKLYSRDVLTCSFSLRDGEYGRAIHDGEVKNRNSDVLFDRFGDDVLATGVEGGVTAAIVDLGPAFQQGKDSSILWSLSVGGDKVVGIPGAAPQGRADVFAKTPLRSNATAPVETGHTYLIKLQSPGEAPRYAAVAVVEHLPGSSVTLRWRKL